MPCGCVLLAFFGLPTLWDQTPKTVRFQIDSWWNNSWGLHNIERARSRCQAAGNSDGSRAIRCEDESFRHYFIPAGDRTNVWRSLYLRPEHAGYEIDESDRTAYGGLCSCTWSGRVQPAVDRGCWHAARFLLREPRPAGTGRIAGYPVVRFQSESETDGASAELSLTPDLGCETMEWVVTRPGTFWIPASRWRYRVTSVDPGPPDPRLFRVPDGYVIRYRLQ